ncbi:MAG: beta-eliminating lyase-related protein [Bryobacteraceae bacterium]|nr:beta-eliminating lyase-related protein [Bryobacteraceae bacterium]MDW8378024.1 beta-eliminating lyase-related protein [Bryobacterales bacterium]
MFRRSFFRFSAAAAWGQAFSGAAPPDEPARNQQVIAAGDGIPLTPREYCQLLEKLEVEPDRDCQQGVVGALEAKFATLLGKERAVFLPTGTLANHLAVRLLAGSRRRILVQADSHLYNDCGDCAQMLSGLNLTPLPELTVQAVEAEIRRAASGRVATPVGALQIETPVRRRAGQLVDWKEMREICREARRRNLGLHLDGARLFIASAYTGVSVQEYAELFDTVYVSLYKCFNAASGAVLAGPSSLLEQVPPLRRIFGATLNQAWPYAAVALHFVEGFEQRFRAAKECSERVIALLERDANFEVKRVAQGSNRFYLRVRGVNAQIFQHRLESAGVTAPPPGEEEWFLLAVNETWNRQTPEQIVAAFRRALG